MARTPDAGRRIVAAARDLFTERGYAATTTRAIAERAGVNEVTLFRRFTSKAGILRALAEEFAEQAAGLAAAALPEPSGSPAETRSVLTGLARMEVRSALANGGLAMRLALEARSTPEVAEVLGAGSAGNFDGLVGYLSRCRRAGVLRADLAPELLAEAFFAVTSNLVLARQLLGTPPEPTAVDGLVDGLVDLFWSGACAPDASGVSGVSVRSPRD